MDKNQAVAQPSHADLQGQQQARIGDLAAPMEEADELDEAADSVVDLSLGNVDQTLAEAESSLLVHLELYQWLGSKGGTAAAYRNLGVLYQTLGDLEPAQAMYNEALKLDGALDRKEGMAASYGKLGDGYQTRGMTEPRRDARRCTSPQALPLAVWRDTGHNTADGFAVGYAYAGRRSRRY